MTSNNYGVMNAMVDIIASPGRAWDEIKGHSGWLWVPLLITLGVSCAAFAYYYTWVDFDWLVEETIRGLPAETRAEAAPGVRQFMSPTSTLALTIGSIVFVTVVIYLISALYYLLAGKIALSGEISFGQWFSLSVWSGFPAIFSGLAMFVVIFMADSNQLSQAELSPLSLNALLIGAEAGEPWFNWGNSVQLVAFWSIFLAGLGIARWTGATLLKGIVIAALPSVLVFGIWAAMI
jgi:hypothetical protein